MFNILLTLFIYFCFLLRSLFCLTHFTATGYKLGCNVTKSSAVAEAKPQQRPYDQGDANTKHEAEPVVEQKEKAQVDEYLEKKDEDKKGEAQVTEYGEKKDEDEDKKEAQVNAYVETKETANQEAEVRRKAEEKASVDKPHELPPLFVAYQEEGEQIPLLSMVRNLSPQFNPAQIQRCAGEIKQLPLEERAYLAGACFSVSQGNIVACTPLLQPMVAEGVLSNLELKLLIQGPVLQTLIMKQKEVGNTPSFVTASSEIVKTVYTQCPPGRALMRKVLYQLLHDALQATPVRQEAILFVLRILELIIKGLRNSIGKEYEDLLTRRLIPLYHTEEMLHDALCVISVYQEPLSKCVRGLLGRLDPTAHCTITVKVFRSIIGYWDKSNSKHCVVMISCFKDLLEEMDGQVFDTVHKDLFSKLAECAASDNALLAREALQLWQQEAFITYLHRQGGAALSLLVPPLIRDAELHWNKDVNSMLLFAINIIKSINEDGERLFTKIGVTYLVNKLKMKEDEAATKLDKYVVKLAAQQSGDATPEQKQIKALQKQRAGVDARAPFPVEVNNHLHFIFGKEIGRGAYSSVKYCKRIEQTVPQSLWNAYAAKVIAKQLIKETNFDEQIEQEIKLLSCLDSPFISPLYAHFEDEKNIYILMEYCSAGDLFSNVFEHGPGSVTFTWAKYGLAQIVMALSYVQEKGYYFGDMKTENILVTQTGHLRLADFGSSKSEQQLDEINAKWRNGDSNLHRDVQGTLDFLSPEIVRKASIGKPADWWALGVMLVQLLFGYFPFTAEDEAATIAKIQTASPKIPADAGASSVLVLGLLNKDPSSRFSVEDCKNSSFFEGVEWDPEKLSGMKLPSLETGYRSHSSLADPKYMTRKFSIVYNPSQDEEGRGRMVVDSIPEEREEELSWGYEPPKKPKPNNPSNAPRMPTTATADNALAEYVTTVDRSPPKRGSQKRY